VASGATLKAMNLAAANKWGARRDMTPLAVGGDWARRGIDPDACAMIGG